MNIRDLKYLTAIADHSHFGKAAEACFVSQPALSMQIKKLENLLGVQLIERTNKSVLLTEVGNLIVDHARNILSKVELMKELAKQAKDPFRGELHIGIIPTLAPYLLPRIIPSITKVFKHLKIFLIEEQTDNLINKLKRGKIDAAIFGFPILEEGFEALPLFEEELLLAMPESHPLAERKVIRHKDLEKQVLLVLEDGHCLRDQVLSLCETVKASMDKSFQATSLETLRYMVASRVGITLIPKLATTKKDGLCYIPFNSPKPKRTLGMIWRNSSTKKVLLENIVMQIRKLLINLESVKVIEGSISRSKRV